MYWTPKNSAYIQMKKIISTDDVLDINIFDLNPHEKDHLYLYCTEHHKFGLNPDEKDHLYRQCTGHQ